jgi:hypothetical protein
LRSPQVHYRPDLFIDYGDPTNNVSVKAGRDLDQMASYDFLTYMPQVRG